MLVPRVQSVLIEMWVLQQPNIQSWEQSLIRGGAAPGWLSAQTWKCQVILIAFLLLLRPGPGENVNMYV